MDKYIKTFYDLGICRAVDVFSYREKKFAELQELVLMDVPLDDELFSGIFFFIKRKQLEIEQNLRKKQVFDLCNEIDSLDLALDHLSRFSPKLLLEYILLSIEKEGKISYEFFENVYFGEYESLNQAIRQYMVSLTGDIRLSFKKYCNDMYAYYHLLLPTSVEDSTSPNSIPVLCFPSGKKVKVLNSDFKLSSKIREFPYLESAMKELVDYRFSHPELTQKEVLSDLIQQKRQESISKTYHF